MTTTDTPMTKVEWLEMCAERLTEKGGVPADQAGVLAAACWDCCAEDVGEESVLTEWPPDDAADEEMSCWEG